MKDRIQHIVFGQRILILLARTQLRRRRLIEDVLRNGAHPFALIEPLRELVHFRLVQVGNGSQTAAGIPIQSAIPGGHFGLVPRSQKHPVEFVGKRHHDHAADAGLDVLFSDIPFPSGKGGGKRFFKGFHHRRNRNRERFHPQIGGQCLGIGNASLTRPRGRHHHPVHVVLAQRVDGKRRDKCGIHAPGKAENDIREAVFPNIIADAGGQQFPDRFPILGRNTRHYFNLDFKISPMAYTLPPGCPGNQLAARSAP